MKHEKAVDWGVLTYTFHPFVIGRGYRMSPPRLFLGEGAIVSLTRAADGGRSAY